MQAADPIETLKAEPLQLDTVNEPRAFEINELFFSTTDDKGRIQSANHVFLRVSEFAAAELKNKPHNIIRHPDMPRVVFQLLWDEILAGRDVLAYVKNRAKDGRYYWVVALVAPIEGGYLSVRFKPSSDLFVVVQDLYRHLHAVEAQVEKAQEGKPAAIAAGRLALEAKLGSLGFADYRAFMHEAFEVEIRSRDAAMKNHGGESRERLEGGAPAVRCEVAVNGARGVAESCQAALAAIDLLFSELAVYSELNAGIRSKSEFISSLSEAIHLLSLNGAIEAHRLGTNGLGMATVLDWLQQYSQIITRGGGILTQRLGGLILAIKSAIFELNSAKLQIEMTTDFALELLHRGISDDDLRPDKRMPPRAMRDLHASSSVTVSRALAAVATVESKITTIEEARRSLKESIQLLRRIHITGKLELANTSSESLVVTFDAIQGHLKDAEHNLSVLETLIQDLRDELHKGFTQSALVEEAVARINPDALTISGNLSEPVV